MRNCDFYSNIFNLKFSSSIAYKCNSSALSSDSSNRKKLMNIILHNTNCSRKYWAKIQFLNCRLLAKAGVKVSPEQLRARASPTGPRRSDIKLDAKSAASESSSVCGDNEHDDLSQSRYQDSMAVSPPREYLRRTLYTSLYKACKLEDT